MNDADINGKTRFTTQTDEIIINDEDDTISNNVFVVAKRENGLNTELMQPTVIDANASDHKDEEKAQTLTGQSSGTFHVLCNFHRLCKSQSSCTAISSRVIFAPNTKK